MSIASDFVDDNSRLLDDDYIENKWQQGYHITQDGEFIYLKDMTTQHLKNTINYFEGSCDTKELEKELKNRIQLI